VAIDLGIHGESSNQSLKDYYQQLAPFPPRLKGEFLNYFLHFHPSHFKSRDKLKQNQIRYGEETERHEKEVICVSLWCTIREFVKEMLPGECWWQLDRGDSDAEVVQVVSWRRWD
jgi:hypothetical protein